ncbi:MAG TPA: hypothetical protein VF862_07805 [Gemmatimonadales bacterium]
MRIPTLLFLASLAACAPGNHDSLIYGTWEVREVTGRASEVFAPGRTLQILEGPTAVVSGGGLATVRKSFQTIRSETVHGTEGLLILFSTDSSGYIVHLPTRTEMLLEENTLDATILRLRRVR